MCVCFVCFVCMCVFVCVCVCVCVYVCVHMHVCLWPLLEFTPAHTFVELGMPDLIYFPAKSNFVSGEYG